MKEAVQKAFRLAELPDDEFMALVSQLGEGEVITGIAAVPGEGYTVEELADELAAALAGDRES